jgi:hypothetical protein
LTMRACGEHCAVLTCRTAEQSSSAAALPCSWLYNVMGHCICQAAMVNMHVT